MSPTPPRDRRYQQTLDLSAPVSLVWESLTDPHRLAAWFATRASVEPRPGGELAWHWGEQHTWRHRIEVFEPERHLRTRYESPALDASGKPRPLFVDFELSPAQGGRTTLRVVHSGFGPEADFDQEYQGISRGWPIELESLRLSVERHPGRDRRVAWVVRPVADVAAVWRELTGDAGLRAGAPIDRFEVGRPFRFECASGDVLEGRTLCCHEREFSGVVTNHGDAFLRVAVERCGQQNSVWLWLGVWDAAVDVPALERRWSAMVDALPSVGSLRSGATS